MFDEDEIKNSLQIAEKFMAEGLNVYFVEVKDQDPNELGFEKISKLIAETLTFSFERLMQLRMKLIWK